MAREEEGELFLLQLLKKENCHWYVLLSEKASAMGKLMLEMIQPSSVYVLNLQNTL